MAKATPISKHACGGVVQIFAQEGGRGSGDPTCYQAECEKCGKVAEFLGRDTGRLRVAIAEWNALMKKDRTDD